MKTNRNNIYYLQQELEKTRHRPVNFTFIMGTSTSLQQKCNVSCKPTPILSFLVYVSHNHLVTEELCSMYVLASVTFLLYFSMPCGRWKLRLAMLRQGRRLTQPLSNWGRKGRVPLNRDFVYWRLYLSFAVVCSEACAADVHSLFQVLHIVTKQCHFTNTRNKNQYISILYLINSLCNTINRQFNAYK